MNRALAILLLATASVVASRHEASAATEYVTVVKVLENDDNGIIQRRNGEKWLIEKGTGARSFWKYQGKSILIHSPGLFCGVGSKVILPVDDQEARIWKAEQLSDAAAPSPQDEAVKAVAAALLTLKYYDPKSDNEDKRDALRALKRFQADNKVTETNRLGPKTLAKLAELLLKEGGDSGEGLELAHKLVESAQQMKGLSPGRDLSGRRPVATTGTFVTSVTGDGAIVRLADGSIYEVDAIDHIKTVLWLPTENILKKPDGLINLDNGESVTATLLK